MSMRAPQGARFHSPGGSAQEMIAETATDARTSRERRRTLPRGVWWRRWREGEAQRILTRWLAQAPEGVRREVQVKYGSDGAQTGSAFVTLRECSVRVADTAETQDD